MLDFLPAAAARPKAPACGDDGSVDSANPLRGTTAFAPIRADVPLEAPIVSVSTQYVKKPLLSRS